MVSSLQARLSSPSQAVSQPAVSLTYLSPRPAGQLTGFFSQPASQPASLRLFGNFRVSLVTFDQILKKMLYGKWQHCLQRLFAGLQSHPEGLLRIQRL